MEPIDMPPARAETMALDEWAARLGVSLPSAYRLAQQNRIPGLIRIGNSWRVSRRVVERQLDGEPVGA